MEWIDLTQFSREALGAGLRCPKCGFECTHIARVSIDQRGNVVEVDEEGPLITRRDPQWSARGSVISIEMWCEAGHQFTLRLQFHKGSTYLRHDIGEDLPLDPETGWIHPGTLWRD